VFEALGRYMLAKDPTARDAAHVHRGYQILGGQAVRPVTIKRLPAPQQRSPELMSLFLEEGRTTARFEHANIVALLDMDRFEGEWFLAFERVQGQDLATVVKKAKLRGVNIDPHTALYLAIQVLQGLSHAHERTDPDGNMLGIVHRDVCPENILIGYGGEVKLTGFTYAKVRGRTNPPQPGAPRPRYAHMSPEQALGSDVDHRADVFSVGLILYELLSGMTAYDSRSELDAFARAQRGQVRSLLEVAPTLGPDLRAVVEKALIFDRKMRHPSALVFRDELARILYARDPTFAAYRIATMMARVLGDEATDDRAREREERIEIEKGLLANTAGAVPGIMPTFPKSAPSPVVPSGPPQSALSTLAGYSSLSKPSPNTTFERPPADRDDRPPPSPFFAPPPPLAAPPPGRGQLNVPTAVIDRSREREALPQVKTTPPPIPPPSHATLSVAAISNPSGAILPSSQQPNAGLGVAAPAQSNPALSFPGSSSPGSSSPGVPGSAAISATSPLGIDVNALARPRNKPASPAVKIAAAVAAVAIVATAVYAMSSERHMRVVKSKLRAAVIGRQPGGMLVLDSLPQGARVIVDGEATGKRTPLTIDNFESGVEHEITLELDGEPAITSSAAIRPGQKKNMTMVFPDAVVDLTVKSDPPGAEVWVDRKSVGFAPEAFAKVKAGQEINLRITKLGYVDFVKAIMPERKKPIALDIKLEKTEALIEQEAAEAEALKEVEGERGGDDAARKAAKRRALPAKKKVKAPALPTAKRDPGDQDQEAAPEKEKPKKPDQGDVEEEDLDR
jgi:eukaryotic-like serine/threonine-protein kinase